MKIKQITDINLAISDLWEHDLASQKINFPQDSPNYELFKNRITNEFNDQPEGFFLIYEDNQIIGSLILKIQLNPYRRKKYGDVRSIYLIDEARGKGYGREALAHADEFFKKRDCKYAFAGVSALNPGSNALFLKLGYDHKRTIYEKDY
jgi:L-amino acid N-acyltransferase YncA